MHKGKYILISKNELVESISANLNIKFDLITIPNKKDTDEKLSSLILGIYKIDVEKEHFEKALKKIAGNNLEIYSKYKSYFEKENKVNIDMKDCSHMFKTIFNINEKVVFNNEVIALNNEKELLLFYSNEQVIKDKYIYTVTEGYQVPDDVVDCRCIVFKTSEEAKEYMEKYCKNHIADFQLDSDEYSYISNIDKDNYNIAFYTKTSAEDIFIYLERHEVSAIEDTDIYLVIYTQSNYGYMLCGCSVFENIEIAKANFNNDVEFFVNSKNIRKWDYRLSEDQFSMIYDEKIKTGKRPDLRVKIIKDRL